MIQKISIIAFVLWISLGSAQGKCPDQIIAYWHLNEKTAPFADAVGDNPAVCGETCPEPTPFGRVEGALGFDGEKSGLDIPVSEIFNWSSTDSFSIEFWMRRDAAPFTGNEVIVGRAEGAGGFYWWVGLNAEGIPLFALQDGSGEKKSIKGANSLADRFWHHIAAVRNAQEKKLLLYVDGRLAAEANSPDFSGGFVSDAANLTIGRLDNGGKNHFQGVIDEVALYGKALTSEEISSHVLDGLADFRWGYCQDRPVLRIMPLGDSITAGATQVDGEELGNGEMAGYRGLLYNFLTQLGYSVDFVGSQSIGQSLQGIDPDAEAHAGLTVSGAAENVYGWLSNNPADMVLLHVGTNDPGASMEMFNEILEEIDRFSPETTIVLARIINRQTPIEAIYQFNEDITALARARVLYGDKIIISDQQSALNYPEDMADEIHPTPQGYQKMAQTWLLDLLRHSAFPPEPVFTSAPAQTELAMGESFAYDANAAGRPAPVYALKDAPAGMIIDEHSGEIQWTAPYATGEYGVTVKAENDAGAAEQYFALTVVNSPPVAAAGEDQGVRVGEKVFLNGSGSYDPDGGIAAYEWTQLSGPEVALSDPKGKVTSFTAPAVDLHGLTFQLRVTDEGDLSSTDEVHIVVNMAGQNLPVADAGSDQRVQKGRGVILDGSSSFDPDGTIVSYRWTQTSGTPVNLSDPTSPQSSFVPITIVPEGEDLLFTLEVIDDQGNRDDDTTTVHVEWINLPPVANPGGDMRVNEGDTVMLNGAESYDPDGGIAGYQWTQIDGPPVVLSDPSAIQPTFVAPAVDLQGISFLLSVEDKGGLVDSDELLITVNDNGIQGFPDDVVTMRSVTGKEMGIYVQGGSLVKLSSLNPTEISDGVNRPENFIYGLLSMDILTDSGNSDVAVTIYLSDGAPEGYHWYRYGAGGWEDFEERAAFNSKRDLVRFVLTDNGWGDNGAGSGADGRIAHLSGLGRIDSPNTVEEDGLIDCFIGASSFSF